MKIILSRKGFDSKNGGCASPILEDGTLVPLPIPDRDGPISYSDIAMPCGCLSEMVENLEGCRITGNSRAHLDPDLRAGALPRRDGWRPMFGQSERAQRHLEKQGVHEGDLFLFYGWFRQVEQSGGKFRFAKGARDLHVLLGWLTVCEIWRLWEPGFVAKEWAVVHPHVSRLPKDRDTVYVGGDAVSGLGSGVFSHVREDLILTAREGEQGSKWKRSKWRLPWWFFPGEGRSALSYHGDMSRWGRCGNHVFLRTTSPGQEFVLDADQYPKALAWVGGLLRGGPGVP